MVSHENMTSLILEPKNSITLPDKVLLHNKYCQEHIYQTKEMTVFLYDLVIQFLNASEEKRKRVFA